jgi:hypothetical protein
MDPALVRLIPLLAAHLLGDFVLQTAQDVANKHRPGVLLRHAAWHAALAYLLIGDWRGWLIPPAVLAGHAAIDAVKVRSRRHGLVPFALDQAAHLLLLGVVSLAAPAGGSVWIAALGGGYLQALVLISGGVISVRVGSIVVGYLVQPMLELLLHAREERRQEEGQVLDVMGRGFEEGGKIIGQLERGLIFLLIIVDQFAAVGFLIAAKSVFRIGEISDRSNRMEAEYIIIGTLWSFLYGMTVSYLTRLVLLAL